MYYKNGIEQTYSHFHCSVLYGPVTYICNCGKRPEFACCQEQNTRNEINVLDAWKFFGDIINFKAHMIAYKQSWCLNIYLSMYNINIYFTILVLDCVVVLDTKILQFSVEIYYLPSISSPKGLNIFHLVLQITFLSKVFSPT